MPTTYSDQFLVMDPGNPPSRNTVLTPQRFDFIDSNDDGFIGTGAGDTFDGLTITSVWVGDTITVRWGGSGPFVQVTGVTFYTAGGPAVFTPTDGTILQGATFIRSTFVNTSTQVQVGAFGPPCFVAGTRIAVPGGWRAVEDLRPGDLVETRDRGPRPLAWTGERTVGGLGRFAPVRVAAGALGNARALCISPQHRLLLGGWRVEMLFGADEVLAAAVHLVDGAAIARAPRDRVRYVHLMFDRHEIVLSEGIPTESFHPGDHVLAGDTALRAELCALFPELAAARGRAGWRTARPVLRAHEAAVWAGGRAERGGARPMAARRLATLAA